MFRLRLCVCFLTACVPGHDSCKLKKPKQLARSPSCNRIPVSKFKTCATQPVPVLLLTLHMKQRLSDINTNKKRKWLLWLFEAQTTACPQKQTEQKWKTTQVTVTSSPLATPQSSRNYFVNIAYHCVNVHPGRRRFSAHSLTAVMFHVAALIKPFCTCVSSVISFSFFFFASKFFPFPHFSVFDLAFLSTHPW